MRRVELHHVINKSETIIVAQKLFYSIFYPLSGWLGQMDPPDIDAILLTKHLTLVTSHSLLKLFTSPNFFVNHSTTYMKL